MLITNPEVKEIGIVAESLGVWVDDCLKLDKMLVNMTDIISWCRQGVEVEISAKNIYSKRFTNSMFSD